MVKKLSIASVIVWLIFGAIAVWNKTHPAGEKKNVLGSTNRTVQPTQETKPEKSFMEETKGGPYTMEIDIKKSYEAVLKTSAGDITIALTASATPVTVNNFIALSSRNFYNNTVFHRVINGFMIQGGDPNGNGTGGPGYAFNDEPFAGDYLRGTVAMANSGPNTNGSQFFIVHKDVYLPKQYVIFGKVTGGINVIDKIATAPTIPGGEGSTPVDPVKITSVDIIEK